MRRLDRNLPYRSSLKRFLSAAAAFPPAGGACMLVLCRICPYVDCICSLNPEISRQEPASDVRILPTMSCYTAPTYHKAVIGR